MMTTPTPSAQPSQQPPSPRRLLKKRYMLGVGAMLCSAALGQVGTLCLPLWSDGTQLCMSLRVVHVVPAAAAELGECTPELEGSNALAGGEEVLCTPAGWTKPDGGPL